MKKNLTPLRRSMRAIRHVRGFGVAALTWSCAQAGGADSASLGDSPGSSTGGARSPGLEITIGGSLSGDNGATSGAPDTCHAQVREGQRVPVDMYLLVDSSGSMAESVAGGTKWDVVSAALIAFLKRAPDFPFTRCSQAAQVA